MILHIHSDASYLSVSNARSRLGGLFLLGNKSPEQDTLNESILNVASVIKNVVASAAKSMKFINSLCLSRMRKSDDKKYETEMMKIF
jgi:hypothetical protein